MITADCPICSWSHDDPLFMYIYEVRLIQDALPLPGVRPHAGT